MTENDELGREDWQELARTIIKAKTDAEAARDHLRTQLERLILDWCQNEPAGDNHALARRQCAADLLAILTERPQEENSKQ